jgi:hypothetical protein
MERSVPITLMIDFLKHLTDSLNCLKMLNSNLSEQEVPA